MSETYTKISALPDSNDNTSAPMTTTYSPINAHPNPYMPPPGGTIEDQGFGRNHLEEKHNLPSRDIKMDTTEYMHDEQTKANYIPNKDSFEDYVNEYETLTEEKKQKHKKNNYQNNLIERILTEFQPIIILFLLFYSFQLPFINTILYSNFKFLFTQEGNSNFYGNLVKAFLFSFVYYVVSIKIPQYL